MEFKKREFSGTLDPEISQREIDHRELSRRAGAEGMVLLENDGTLPLAEGSPLAVYSGGALYTIKGGTGSGSVNNRQNVCIADGIRNAGIIITTEDWLTDYKIRYEKAAAEWKDMIYACAEPGVRMSLYKSHASHPMQMPEGALFTKTEADTALYVISRISGESTDRKDAKGDYYLSDLEEHDLEILSNLYPNLILILNVGGIIDLSFMDRIHISALVLMSQAGMEGGNALADVLTGKINFCGKLTDTWAYHYEDYPSAATFSHKNGNLIQEKYNDGIFVGYRYFDSFEIRPRYVFGAGLSYTTFSAETTLKEIRNGYAVAEAAVTNTGSRAGKEAVLVFASCPQKGLRIKERRRLVGFGKTKELQPGQTQVLQITFSLRLLESYHTGKACCFLDKGAYILTAGTSSDSTKAFAALTLKEDIRVQQLTNICPLLDALTEIHPSAELIDRAEKAREELLKTPGIKSVPVDDEVLEIAEKLKKRNTDEINVRALSGKVMNPQNVHNGAAAQREELAEEILSQMTAGQKAGLVCGQVTAGYSEVIGAAAIHTPGAAGETSAASENLGVGEIILADGPAGLRLQKRYEENPEDHTVFQLTPYQALENRFFGTEFLHEGSIYHYQFCSAIPVGTLLAQTFDHDLIVRVGELIGREMKEFGVTLWLAPGMNIHRNPLCGRNFEYYSEDPLVSGIMAGAMTEGVQHHPGIGTTIKHYAANNQEDNRMGVSSIVSERALREIYLKGFEIAIKQNQPMAIMTSYNRLNSVHTANSFDLCTTAARTEWGFEGIIMTDWLTTNADHGSSAVKCVKAGNDLIMPGNFSDINEILDALEEKNDLSLKEEELDACVLRMLRIILKSDIYEGAESYAKNVIHQTVMMSEGL